MNNDDVGKKIKDIRISMGMTQEMFANKLNDLLNEKKISKGTVNNWEHSRNLPNKKRIKAISDISGIPINSIIGKNNYFLEQEEKEKSNKELVKLINQRQSELKITNTDLANKIGIPLSTFYRHKRSNFSQAPVQEALKVFETLNISPRMMVSDELPFFESFEEFLKREKIKTKFHELEPSLTVNQFDKVLKFARNIISKN